MGDVGGSVSGSSVGGAASSSSVSGAVSQSSVAGSVSQSSVSGSVSQSSVGGAIAAVMNMDHGNLLGLADDDHTQYLLVDGTRAMTGALDMGTAKIENVVDPTSDQEAATKKYVDDSIIIEDLWNRVGTTLEPSNANDNVNIGAGIFTGGDLQVDNIINVGASGEPYVNGIVDMHGTKFPIARYANKVNGNDSGSFSTFGGINSTNYLTKISTGTIGNGFGHGLVFGAKGAGMSGDNQFITRVYCRVDDNNGSGTNRCGRLQFWVGSNGTKRSLDLTASGLGRFEENIQVQGTTTPYEGVGGELRYANSRASLLGYNRDSSVYIPVELRGSSAYFNIDGNDELITTAAGTTIGSGAVGVNYTLTFNGESNDGVITWMEDENYFEFDDVYLTGEMTAQRWHSRANTAFDMVAHVLDSGTQDAFVIRTAATVTNADIMSIRNNTSEKIRVQANGNTTVKGGLTVTSSSYPFQPPRVTTAQKNAMSPNSGGMVFDVTLAKLCVYNGAAWETVTSA